MNNSIGNNGAKEIGEALKTNETLSVLNISNNSIKSEGAKGLSVGLKENHSLTELWLRIFKYYVRLESNFR